MIVTMAGKYSPRHFSISFPRDYVVHLETNRPDKLNAYFEESYLPSSSSVFPRYR